MFRSLKTTQYHEENRVLGDALHQGSRETRNR